MRIFIKRVFIFSLPLLILILNYQNYSISGGDLNRLGKISVEGNYRNKFHDELNAKLVFNCFISNELNSKDTINILTIGDSFSQQDGFGYQNNLAKEHKLKIINFDNRYHLENPIQMLYCISKGDFLDSLKVHYIILESVEREFVLRGKNLDTSCIVSLKDFNSKFLKPVKLPSSPYNSLSSFQNIINYNVFEVLYNFNPKAYYSQVYKFKLNKKVFSTKNNDLLCYHGDIENLKQVQKDTVENLNNKLNALSKRLNDKGIKLIVLPCPDKYDIYSDFIVNNKFPKNYFFEYMNDLKKDYIYINTKDLLLKNIKTGTQDIYFADDTHWSPLGTKIVSDGIYKFMK